MPLVPSPPPEARRILALADRDRQSALDAVAKLSLDEQVALVCASPPGLRSLLLELTPLPERVIPALPVAELCYTAKAVGLHDAGWILEHASPEQTVACIDLDAWRGQLPDRPTLSIWLRALADAGDAPLLAAATSLDAELMVLALGDRIEVALKPSDSESGGYWQPPAGSRSVDGQFFYRARRDKDDLSDIEQLLRGLFESAYWTYFRLLQGVIWESAPECEEWARRWRQGRLLDLGFPDWEESMAVYGRLSMAALGELPEAPVKSDDDPWPMPIWMPDLPAVAGEEPSLFRALAALSEAERAPRVREFVALANKVAVANHLELGDAESLPAAFERAAAAASRGLDFVAAERGVAPSEVVRRLSLDRLFRVGVNLTGELPDPPADADDSGSTD